MRENDIIFFNLHRQYLCQKPNYGGFLGIFYLASFLNQNGYTAQAYAGLLNDGKELLDEACSNGLVSAIGLYCDYENVTENIFFSSYIKEKYGIPVFVGGPQATALGKAFICKSKCDAIVLGEGEFTILELLNCFLDDTLKLSEITGITFLDNDALITTNARALIDNLDALPMVTDECFLVSNTRFYEHSIMGGRGCPFHCAFCYEGSHTKKVRLRSPKSILEEIRVYLKWYYDHGYEGVPYILFVDDTFTLKSDRVKEICQGIEEVQKIYKFIWFCEGHIHTLYLHPEMLDYLAKAGLFRLQLGIEAGCQEVLDAYSKGCTSKETEWVIRQAEKLGIKEVFGNFILGGALFSREIYAREVAFAKHLMEISNGILELNVVSFWPLPETPITKCPEKYGIIIKDYDFLTSTGDFPQIATSELSRIDIMYMVRNMQTELEQHAKMLLLEKRIPLERIIDWFSYTDTNKYRGYWWTILEGLPQLFSYYFLLSSKGIIRTIEREARMKARPMRVAPLGITLEYKEETKQYIYCGLFLNDLEFNALLYMTGKLTLSEILDELIKIKTNLNINEGVIAINDFLDKLEDNRMVVYSEY